MALIPTRGKEQKGFLDRIGYTLLNPDDYIGNVNPKNITGSDCPFRIVLCLKLCITGQCMADASGENII